jgi:osmotically-inducible protein OsmY
VSTDNPIENEVLAALKRDPRVKHPELIAVSVDEIGTVVLRGAVESPRQRMAAVHDARRVDGVFEVIDHLKVHPPLTDHRTDDEIRAAALQRLTDDARIHPDHIHVKVAHGWVTLTGHVMEQFQSDLAAEDVANVAGVEGVTNQIVIR